MPIRVPHEADKFQKNAKQMHKSQQFWHRTCRRKTSSKDFIENVFPLCWTLVGYFVEQFVEAFRRNMLPKHKPVENMLPTQTDFVRFRFTF